MSAGFEISMLGAELRRHDRREGVTNIDMLSSRIRGRDGGEQASGK